MSEVVSADFTADGARGLPTGIVQSLKCWSKKLCRRVN